MSGRSSPAKTFPSGSHKAQDLAFLTDAPLLPAISAEVGRGGGGGGKGAGGRNSIRGRAGSRSSGSGGIWEDADDCHTAARETGLGGRMIWGGQEGGGEVRGVRRVSLGR